MSITRKTGTLIAKELSEDGDRSWKVTTQPLIEPVTVDEAKIFSRIDTIEEDNLIEGFIESVRMAAEEYLGRAFISQTITTVLDFWPGKIIELPRPPLISVTGIYTVDEDDVEKRRKVKSIAFGSHYNPSAWSPASAFKKMQKAPDYRKDLDLFVLT